MDVERQWIIGTFPDCDVRVACEYASAYHCVVIRTPTGEFYVKDLGSKNGTYTFAGDARREPVIGWKQIRPGDWLIIGRTRIPWPRTPGG